MKRSFSQIFGALTWLVVGILVLLMVIFWPFIMVWSVNTLFATAIAYSFETWLAALILTGAPLAITRKL